MGERYFPYPFFASIAPPFYSDFTSFYPLFLILTERRRESRTTVNHGFLEFGHTHLERPLGQYDPLGRACTLLYTEQMDAGGLGHRLLLTPLGTPRKSLKSRP